MSGLADLSLIEVAGLIRRSEVSSEEVTRACLERAEKWQPTLNCFIALEVEEGLAAARAADARLAKGILDGPLHGVPLAHKDIFDRKGKFCTCGTRPLGDGIAGGDATVLARLRAAGAIQIGTLNLPQFALNPTGHNLRMGPCRNPWNTAHISGGSSSGSAAAVAARVVFGSLGSDSGGSIRLPAAVCGLSGIKATAGRVSRHGVMPLSFSLDCVGPLARTVADCARLTRVTAGADLLDPTSAADAVPDYEAALEAPIKGLRIGVPKGYFDRSLDPDVESALRDSTRVFLSFGCSLVDMPMPDLEVANAGCGIIMSAEVASLHARLLRERPSDYTADVRMRVEAGIGLSAVQYLEALKMRGPALSEFCRSVFDKCDALLAPVLAIRTPTIEEIDLSDSERIAAVLRELSRLTRPFNFLGLPALSIPAGFSSKGLPIGIQLVGRPFAEELLFRLGHAFQEATDWHLRAPTA